MKPTSRLLLTAFLASSLVPFALHADSLTVEGDLNVEASGTASGDLTIDNKLTVNPDTSVKSGVSGAFKIEENGVIWAGFGERYNSAEMMPEENGVRLMWIPQSAAFRAGETADNYWDYSQIGQHSFAAGCCTTASGHYSTAWGYYGYARGTISTAWGYDGYAADYLCTAWGMHTNAYGECSTAWGEYASALGDSSTAWGMWTSAIGYYSTAWGAYAEAFGLYTTAWGYETTAKAYVSTAIGAYNVGRYTFLDDGVSYNDGDTEWFDLDPLLEVGNGTSSNRSNALTIIKNGQTTLANKYWDDQAPTAIPDDPDTELDGDQSSAGEALVVNGHGRLNGNLAVQGNVTIAGEVMIARLLPQGDISMGSFGE